MHGVARNDLPIPASIAPLRGKRVMITRPRARAETFAERLRAVGAEPVIIPTIEIQPRVDIPGMDRILDRLDAYAWVVFTSVEGVELFFDARRRAGASTGFGQVRVAAIGPATAEALQARNLEADFVPAEFVAERIIDGMGNVEGTRVLLPRAARAREALPNGLRARGARVEEIALYDTVAPPLEERSRAEIAAGVDVITFTSSSTVEHFHTMLGPLRPAVLERAIVACIGPITANTAREFGMPPDIVATRYTTQGLVEALVAFFGVTEDEVS